VIVGPTVTGIVDRAPHPEAARLFVDWLLSPVGQAAYVKANYYYSLRKDVAAPPGGRPIAEMNVLVPDWDESVATHGQYVKEWNALVGLR
jgi:iron(III) transport system substrate-binding protein